MSGAFPTLPSTLAFEVIDLGLIAYQAAWDAQKEHHARVAAGGRPTLLLAEHPAVLTLGRKAAAGDNIVVTREYLAAQQIGVYQIERGGDVTYHGPGQLVMYAIFPVGRKVRDFLRLLEEATLKALAALNLRDTRPNPGYAGIYVPDREINGLSRHQKIASIGVAIKRHVALHGVGLNVSTNLDHFDLIVPCGLTDTQMTSIEREYQWRGLGEAPGMDAVKSAVAEAFAETFRNYDWTLPALPFQTLPIQPIPSAGGPA
ncbi:lipoyl(octanoyl) transferase LipB [Deinococcus rubellus]|uniref:Octanoyltransferase n=1 Tax=Deinococcus rubellus TaxID=1889240 RepID=A0ABY5YHA5_9DEIO|nr:lipoyl(octanoyl) transferase LipB [Deinococcus rubellus]UWX64499.1 lipoyl(octanoyl) transferase LipB [Deinococcus rubellus]